MSVCLEIVCRSGTFAYWATLGRFDQRPHKQGKCIMHRHMTIRLRTLQRTAVLSGLSIYEFICIKLPGSAFVSQPVANMHITLGYYGLWRFFFGGGEVRFFPKARPRTLPPTSEEFRRPWRDISDHKLAKNWGDVIDAWADGIFSWDFLPDSTHILTDKFMVFRSYKV